MDQITPPLTCTLYGMPILNKIEVPRLIFYMSSKNMINILQDGPLLLATGFTGGRTPISGLLTLLLAAIGPIFVENLPKSSHFGSALEHVENHFLCLPRSLVRFHPFFAPCVSNGLVEPASKILGSFTASSRSEGLTSNSGSRRGWLFGGQTCTSKVVSTHLWNTPRATFTDRL